MRGALVMTMVMISPPGGKCPRQNSSAGALDWFRQGSASWRRSLVPKGCLLFFSHRKTSYRRRWASESHLGAHEVGGAPSRGGRALRPRGQGVGPLWYFFLSIILINSKNDFRGVSGLLELRRIGFQYLLLFSPECQLPAFSLLM